VRIHINITLNGQFSSLLEYASAFLNKKFSFGYSEDEDPWRNGPALGRAAEQHVQLQYILIDCKQRTRSFISKTGRGSLILRTIYKLDNFFTSKVSNITLGGPQTVNLFILLKNLPPELFRGEQKVDPSKT
jgi:hypothetical protein